MCDDRFLKDDDKESAKNKNYRDITKDIVKGLKSSGNSSPISISCVSNEKGNAASKLEKLLMYEKLRNSTLFRLLPGFIRLNECSQMHPAHRYNVLTHTKKVIQGIPKDIEGEIAGIPKPLFLRYVALYHDTGKPDKKYEDENGVERFHGHEEKSAEIAEESLRYLGYGKEMIAPALRLIKVHDMKIDPTHEGVAKAIKVVGEDIFELLIIHQEADLLAHRKWYADKKIQIIKTIKAIYRNEFNK